MILLSHEFQHKQFDSETEFEYFFSRATFISYDNRYINTSLYATYTPDTHI